MKRLLFLLLAFTVAVMSWEGQLASANLVDNGPIPQESIRLRIIANSDSIQDQWLKQEVRDAIVAQMNTWVTTIDSYDQAKELVAGKLPELQKLVDKTIADRGFTYAAQVDFGQVPFPTKLYGTYVYPAGNYEALRVRIGEAQGQNWWCVLFPPLCFIDMANGDAITKKEDPLTEQTKQAGEESAREGQTGENSAGAKMADGDDEWGSSILEKAWSETNEKDKKALDNRSYAEADSLQNDQAAPTATAQAPQVEVRFYLWDKLVSLF